MRITENERSEKFEAPKSLFKNQIKLTYQRLCV